MDIYRRVTKTDGHHAEYYLAAMDGICGIVHISEEEYNKVLHNNKAVLTEVAHVFDNECYSYTIHTTKEKHQ